MPQILTDTGERFDGPAVAALRRRRELALRSIMTAITHNRPVTRAMSDEALAAKLALHEALNPVRLRG